MSALARNPIAILSTVQDDALDPDLPADERELVERARVDPHAFAELYQRYFNRVYTFAWRRTGSVEAAQDICAATFEAVFRNLHTFRWRRGGFAPWLFKIAANQTVGHHRREARQRSDRGQTALARLHEPISRDDAALIGDDDNELLRTALDRLNPRYQEAITLRHLAGLDPAEAADAMGLNRAALAVVLSRGLKALRRELEQLTEEVDA